VPGRPYGFFLLHEEKPLDSPLTIQDEIHDAVDDGATTRGQPRCARYGVPRATEE
jgi:hypothetical protein